ncbi:hypothetical protein QYM36_018028 [Artemia franciscana]|uniref:Uncharacterized protein n=1 Tax=Artemia franciscana TaxID=6661 RepID=A0AA88H9V4_ARTSF|nr:hypothetical protein QYM36_018028 [Artemia franciscana]
MLIIQKLVGSGESSVTRDSIQEDLNLISLWAWVLAYSGESLQVKWNSIKWLNYSIELPTKIHFRYNYDSDFSVIKVKCRMTHNKNSLKLVSAYKGPIPLPPAKYKDLMDLCHTLVIPRTCHKFYAALPLLESTRDALDESDVKEEDPEDLQVCIHSNLSSLYSFS